MNETSIFDKLAQNLSSGERKDLLRKISQSISVSEEPLTVEEKPKDIDLEDEFQKLGLLRKFFIALTSFFSGLSKHSLVQELILKDIKIKIERTCPGLIDFKHGHFTEKMEQVLQDLKKTTSIFRDPLSFALGDAKEDFIAFFASTELEYANIQLATETDPFQLSRELKTDDDGEIRRALDAKFDEILAGISSEERERIYQDFRALHQLHDLCYLRFDELLRRFMAATTPGKRICRLADTEQHLLTLGDSLFGARLPPSKNILKAVFLFSNQDKLEDQNCDLQALIEAPMVSAESALATIRKFNQVIPLVTILRYITRNVNYFPKHLGGGEDWFVLYKNFWRNRIEAAYRVFVRSVKRNNLLADARNYLEQVELHRLNYYRNNVHYDDLKVKHYHSLSFAYTFSTCMFQPKMNRTLRILHISGEFYKEDNRVTFTDSYNGVNRIEDTISKLDQSLAPSGELGKTIEEVRREALSESVKKVRIQEVINEADHQAEGIIEGLIDNVDSVMKVINGILYGEVGGEYDTISNLGVIGGRENKLVLVSWEKTLKRLEKALTLLQDLYDLE